MKNCLFVSIQSPGYNSEGIGNGLKYFFEEVICFDWQAWRFSNGIISTRNKIVDLAIENKTDLIFLHIQRGDILDNEAAIVLNSVAPTVNYTFDVRGNITWYKNIAPFITHTFFACQEDVNECISERINNISLLQSSCNYEWYKRWRTAPLILNPPPHPEIVFIGNNYEGAINEFPLSGERQRMIEFLYDSFGDKFAAYGLGQKEGMVNPQQEINILNRAKIVVCQNNFSRNQYQSDRVWRSLGCGTFTLLKSEAGVGEIFQIENDCDVWHDFADLKIKIEYYLENEKERKDIAASGNLWATSTQRWQDRVKNILEVIGVKS